MSESFDLGLYRERAAKWRADADRLPLGSTRDSYMAIVEGYLRLVEILERRIPGGWLASMAPPDQSPSARM